jgi:hypothetical protein
VHTVSIIRAMMEELCSSEMLVYAETTWCYILDGFNILKTAVLYMLVLIPCNKKKVFNSNVKITNLVTLQGPHGPLSDRKENYEL